MKHKFSSMGRVAIALVLALSLSLVMAVPAAATVTTPTVVVNPTEVLLDAQYTITFTTTEDLSTVGPDEIYIEFPVGTTVGGLTPAQITVNAVAVIVATVEGQLVIIEVPENIPASAVTVIFTNTAGISNPTTAGVYALTVETNKEPTAVTSKGYAIGDPVIIVDSVDNALVTVVNGTSFYVHVTDGAPVQMWNTHPAMVDTLAVTVNTYDGATNGTPTSTATYTATETDKDTGEFWTNAINTGDLNVRPGYKLEVYPRGTTATGEAFIRAEISFDKSYYDVNETMTITIKDESPNASKTDADTFGHDVLVTDVYKTFTETGVDTGVFTWSGTPSDNDFAPGVPMTATYNAATTGGDDIKATAAVLMYSTSSVKFDKGTYAVDANTATITVTDTDKAGTITGADCLVVENLTTGDSVSFDTLSEGATTGEFPQTVTFGTDTDELAINDGDTLKATYTDPATPEDVSTATAAVGYTVFLYNADGTLDSSYTTIEAAVNGGATIGWTVKVSEAYNSTDEDFPITISVEGLTVESVAGAASTIIDASETVDIVAVDITATANNVTFDGFTVQDADACAIQTLAEGTIIQNNIITREVNGQGINLGGVATDVLVTGNELDINSTMYVTAGISDCTLSDNTFGAGINLARNNSNITITGNTIIGSEFEGIAFDDKNNLDLYSNILIEGNTISQTTPVNPGDDVAGIYVRGDTVTNLQIIGNDITDNEGVGIKITANTWDTGNVIKFNNITGNEDYGIETSENVDATHNWWGTSDPSADTFSGSVTYEPCLGASIVRGAAAFAVGDVTSLNAKATVGVQVSGVPNDTGDNAIGAALYAANPKATFTALENGFVDVYVVPGTIDDTDVIVLKFYAGDVDSVVYAWNELEGWEECTLQGYSSYGGYIWVKVHSEIADVVTVPTIEALEGLPFAISGEEAPPSTIQLYEGANPIYYTGATMDLPEALTDILAITEIIWQKDVSTGGKWWLYFVEWGTGEITQLENGRVYIIVVSEDCTWELAQ